MNESNPNDTITHVPWPTSGHRAQVPDSSMRPGSEQDAPAVQQLGDAGDAWSERLRATVRHRPMTSLAAALALGAVVARITR